MPIYNPSPPLRSHKRIKASSGTISITTSWALVNAVYTLTIPAAVGDEIEMVFEGIILPNAAISLQMDYEIGGARQGDTTLGSWANTINNGWWGVINPHWVHTVISGDVSSGQVTVKPWIKGQSAQNFVNTPRPTWFVRNLGPQAA